MHHAIGKGFLLSMAVIFLAAATAWAPVADARPAGGGAHAGGNRAAAAPARGGGGGGGAQHVNNQNVDARANNVRSNSVNSVNTNRNVNVNSNRNVNVNVEGGGGCCHNGWDNDYHPVATAAAVTATVAVTSAVIGSMVRTVPPGCAPVNYGGMVYQQCGTTWYQPQGSQYVVVNPPY
ncbi:hypothetical protein AB4120_10060 [Cupriavidus sp. 2KB_3]|uniref:hypothetical protein n=1 Tax=Cupriavidus TaxID=106589 RepID=UPI0011EBCA6A|nr:hypothetical protein [Cupriavidus campinensis]